MSATPRVRFAPSPTGFLHIGSARTFIFNWLYARHHHGIMLLRIDDTDIDRNTQASLDSIFDGLKWLDLGWDEEYRQSDRGALHREMAWGFSKKDWRIAISRPASAGSEEEPHGDGAWLFNPGDARARARRKPAPRRRGRAFRAALSRPARRVCAACNSTTACTPINPSPPPTSRISLCCAATASPLTTWPPAPTTSICTSATSSAVRTTSPTPSSTY